MNVEELRDYCIAKKDVTEGFPFGDDTLVFKVNGKIFALMNLEGDLTINLKCDPVIAVGLRENYPSVIPGYHMNKKHWNTVIVDGSVPDSLIFKWIDHSYSLVKRTGLRSGRHLSIRKKTASLISLLSNLPRISNPPSSLKLPDHRSDKEHEFILAKSIILIPPVIPVCPVTTKGLEYPL